MASLCVSTASLASSASLCTSAGLADCKNASSASIFVSLKGRYPEIVCGRGDRRTAKGKRARGSFGNCRPKDSTKGTGLAVTPLPPRPNKKDVEDTEFTIETEEGMQVSAFGGDEQTDTSDRNDVVDAEAIPAFWAPLRNAYATKSESALSAFKLMKGAQHEHERGIRKKFVWKY